LSPGLDPAPFLVSLRLAAWVTGILLVLSFPLAWAFARSRTRCAILLESLACLPLVLSPTVLGFYLLLLVSPRGWLGAAYEQVFRSRLAFSFPGIVFGECVSSLPFMLTALKTGVAGVPENLFEASYTLGKGRVETALRVVLPNMRPALLAGAVTTFAHALGEFGVALMIGGSVPDRTKTVSIAVFERVEALDYAGANHYSLALVAASYLGLLLLNGLQEKSRRRPAC
jgi:molybdate ABC transporter, permease protein